MKNHSLITTLKNLTGNPRGCIYTEPLWGIPYNLYAPYASVYMISLGLTDKQIGLIISIAWGFQILWALMSGVITDKMGRRRTTLLADVLSWSVPALIAAVAQNFWYFLAAAIINSVWRVSHNAWTCLLVEDADPAQLVDIYSWIYIAGLLVAFFAPLAGLLIRAFTLVPTMRGLYLLACGMFTVKCIATYFLTTETRQGQVRMHETKHQSIPTILGEYRGVFSKLVRTPETLYTGGIMLVLSICLMINGTFWAIIVTEKLHIPAQNLAIFPFVKSIVMLLFFFVVVPRLRAMPFKLPLVFGFAGAVISQLVLILAPENGYLWLLVSTFLEAGSLAAINPLVDRMVVLTVAPQERARIQSILYVGIILFTAPFGWVAGTLSGLNKNLPFILSIALLVVGGLLAYLAGRVSEKGPVPEPAVAEPIA